MKRLSNDFRNVTPGKNKLANTTMSNIPPNGKTPLKNPLNISQLKKSSNEEMNNSNVQNNFNNTTLKDRDKSLKRLNSKKAISTSKITKPGNNNTYININSKPKQSLNGNVPTNISTQLASHNLDLNNKNNVNNNNFYIKKMTSKELDSLIDTTDKEKRKSKIYEISKQELLDAEKELNVSNLIQLESNISDDLLLYNKEEQLLHSEFQNKDIHLMSKFNILSTPKSKYKSNKKDDPNSNNNINYQQHNNLEYEEILDDKWDNISKFLTLKDIATISYINKKLGKNCIISLIDELEKEKLFYEEKVLSSVA